MQGQSLTTIDKERKLGAMFDMTARLWTLPKVLGKAGCAFHIDLNAGCGFNHDFRVPGSPLVFMQVMRSKYPQVPYRAWFIDKNPEAIRELSERIQQEYNSPPYVHVVCADNGVALQRIADVIPRYATGMVVVDPNGWLYRNKETGDGVHVDALRSMMLTHERMDVVMNLNAQFYRRARGLPQTFPHIRSVSEFHWLLNKSDWLITNPVHNGHTDFVCVVGRNFATGAYAAYDWHRLTSKAGMKICERLEIAAHRPQSPQSLLFTQEGVQPA